MKRYLSNIITVCACVGLIIAFLWVKSVVHANDVRNAANARNLAMQKEDTAIAIKLSANGLTGFGLPDITHNNVPLVVNSDCTVNFQYVTNTVILGVMRPVALELTFSDHDNLLLGSVDAIYDSHTEALVTASLVATLQANAKNKVCKTPTLASVKKKS